MEVSSSGSTFSWRLTVFSKGSYNKDGVRLTCLSVVLDAEKLGLVVPGDGGVGISVSWKEGQLFGHIVGLHWFYSMMWSFE